MILLKWKVIVIQLVFFISISETKPQLYGTTNEKCERCAIGMLKCRSSCKCYDESYKCDGTYDCNDNSDEESCNLQFDKDECPGFVCQDKTCISNSQVCDGIFDCPGDDVSDEQVACDLHCSTEEFTCKNGQCISLHSYCDGITNCGDGSDETSCPKYEVCNYGESACRDGTCIMQSWFCDGDPDCADFSDEENCQGFKKDICLKDEFQCESSKVCIPKHKMCDKKMDCADSSDEKYCTKKCLGEEFMCENGECIPTEKVCDNIPDCSDNSDEKPAIPCSSQSRYNYTTCSINNGNCQHQCRYTIKGLPECICENGYILALDKVSCLDIDECVEEGSCSQKCVNTDGSYTCFCLHGYTLARNGKTCKANGPSANLLLTDKTEIKRIIPETSGYEPILKNLTNAIGIDYDMNRSLVYWSDVELDIIMRSYINGSDVREIVSIGLETPSGIACDWIHGLLFWADSGTKRIEVSDFDGRYRKVLIWDGLEKPRSLAVHPNESFIFWLDWGTIPRLERSTMDGGSRLTLASTNLQWPNGITIDYVTNTIYWTDAKFHVIERIDIYGNGRKSILSRGLPHPFGISVFEDFVYWTDWKTRSLTRANKFTGSNVKSISNNFRQPMSIASFHPLRQKQGVNRCLKANCSHLCLPTPQNVVCACPTGFAKINETHCEEGIDKFLIFATDKDIRRISLVDDKKLDVVLPIKNMEKIVGLDWHSATDHQGGTLFWSDIENDKIYRSDWDGQNEKEIIASSLDSPCGVAVDWVTEKLYWTDAGFNRIEVSLLDGSMRTILIHTDLDKPRGIAVHPQSGRLVFTDWGKTPRIEVAGMDGNNRKTIVSVHISWPNDITIDHLTERVYWTDALEDIIESCFLDGSDRRVLVSTNIKHPFGITVDQNNIYWSDWGHESVFSVNKNTGR